jgi:translocation and assembly module TamB
MRQPTNPGAKARARVMAGHVARAALLLLIFGVSTLAGGVLHVDTAAGRRLVAREVNAAVSSLVTSELRIEKIDTLSFDRLVVSRARLIDPQGRPIMTAEGLEARFELIALLRGVLSGSAVRVHVPAVTIRHFALGLSEDPARSGHFTLERAFDARTPPSGGGPDVIVELPSIAVRSAAVRTNLRALAESRADIGALNAGLDISTSRGVVLTLATKDARIARVLAKDIRGKLGAEIRLPGATKADFDVHAGAAPVTGTFGFERGALAIRARSSALEPAALRELFGSWPLVAPVDASAELLGPPESMQVKAEARRGRTRALTTGRLSLTPELAAALDVTAEALDLRLFSAGAPPTALDVRGRVEIRLEPELEVRATANVPASEVSGLAVPPFDVTGTYKAGRFAGSAKVLDPQLPATVEFEVEPGGRVQFSAHAKELELRALRRYGIDASGIATLRTQGVLEAGVLNASLHANGRAVAVAPVRAATVTVSGRVEGALDQARGLRVEGVVSGTSLRVGNVRFDRFEAKSAGSGPAQRVSLVLASNDGPRLEASADARFAEPVVLTALEAEARHDDAVTKLTTSEASFGRGHLTIRGFSLRAGSGTLKGSAELQWPRERVDLTAENLDLAVLGASVGLDSASVSGRIDARVLLEERSGGRNGQATASVRDARLGELGRASGEVALDFDGPKFGGRGKLELAGLARATLSAEGELPGSLAAPELLDRLSGESTLRIENIELGEISRRWLEETGVRLEGHAEVELHLLRRTRAERPEVSYRARTEHMVVAAVFDRSAAGKGELVTHLDLTSQGELFRADGNRLTISILDARGTWLEILAKQGFGAGALEHALEHDSFEAAWDAPLEARVVANRRPVSALGAGLSSLQGDVSAVAGITGSLRRPDLTGAVEFRELDVPVVGGEKVDLDLDFLYSAGRRRYAIEASTRSLGDDHVEVRATGTLAAPDGAAPSGPTARVEASVERVDLGRIASIVDQPLEGRVSGHCSLALGGGAFDASAELDLENIRVEQRELGQGKLRVRIENGRTQATFRIADRHSRLELAAAGGFSWTGAGLVRDPRVDRQLQLTASNFELANVGPWLKSFATQLSGKLNGHAELGWQAGAHPTTTLRANATISNGTASLTAGGGMIRAIEVAAIGEQGKPLELKFKGAARSRHPNIQGTAELNLNGLALERFDAKVRVDGFPLVYEGVMLGKATIARDVPPLRVVLEQRAQHTHVAATIPAVEVALPEASDTTLIALDDDPAVTVLEVARESDALAAKRETARGTTISVELGRRVQVVQGELKVPVTGKLDMDAHGRLTGTLRFPAGGVVPALGHTFRIRDGFVRFKDQEVNDGVVSIQATTRTADATAVELNVSGTVGTPVLRFQSDPPRSEEEIVALLVGLRPEDSAGEEGQQLGGVAWALAMNRLVKGSALSGLQFGAGQTSEGNEVKTISMRVSNKVWLEGRSVRGSETSLNQSDNASGVVDWRFAPSFSLRTQLGTVSGVELRWSHGY